MKAEIIAVGTEILLGQIVNTNAAFLARELADLGFDVYHQSVVGDNGGRLADALRQGETRSDLIVLCGGLGPTPDDLTKQVTAAHVGATLIQDEAGYQKLQYFFSKRPTPMTENNLLQVQTFQQGQTLQNPTGLAVGIFYTDPRTQVHYLLLPGPPKELAPMFQQVARPLLQALFPPKERLYSRVLRFYGIGESRLVTELADLIEEQTNPTIAPYAKPSEVTLRLSAKASDERKSQELLDQLEETIQERVGAFFYGYGEENDLATVVVEQLKAQGKTLTAAESLTAGQFQSQLGKIPGVSAVFPGGFVTYSLQTKRDFLQIDSSLLETYGTVSQECVEAMARQSLKLAQTDYSLAFTGVAGPERLEGQEVGTVWIALATKGAGVQSQSYHFANHREAIRYHAVMAGFGLLYQNLKK
ncbi:competence/damage-inducible protein A [Enterococcus sp. LJL98]